MENRINRRNQRMTRVSVVEGSLRGGGGGYVLRKRQMVPYPCGRGEKDTTTTNPNVDRQRRVGSKCRLSKLASVKWASRRQTRDFNSPETHRHTRKRTVPRVLRRAEAKQENRNSL